MESVMTTGRIRQGLLASLFICFSVSSSLAEEIPLVSELDLLQEGMEAQKQGKQLVIIYRQPGCEPCKKFIRQLAETKQAGSEFQASKFYQVNMQGGIDVVCPGGLELSDGEFYQSKGIKGDMSIVFHDSEGHVIYTHTGIPSMTRMVSLSSEMQEQRLSQY